MLNWKERLRGGVVQGVLQLDLGEASEHNDFKATVLAHKGVHFFISGRSGRSLIERRHINVRGRWLGGFCMRWIFQKCVAYLRFFAFVGYFFGRIKELNFTLPFSKRRASRTRCGGIAL